MTTTGLPTTCGSRILQGWVPPYDATVVARLRAAGCRSSARRTWTSSPMGSSTEHSAYGPSHNPWDLDRIPGGSGGGSSSVRGRLFPGPARDRHRHRRLDPPAGRGDRHGRHQTDLRRRLALRPDSPSPPRSTRPARARARFWTRRCCTRLMAGHDPLDSTSIDARCRPDRRGARRADVSGMRIGIVRADRRGIPGRQRRFDEAVQHLVDAGAEVVEVSCPSFTTRSPTYYLILPSEASSNLAKFDAMRYGLRVAPRDVDDPSPPSRSWRPPVTPASATRSSAASSWGTYALSAATTTPTTDRPRRFAGSSPTTSHPPSSAPTCWSRPPRRRPPSRLGAKIADPLSMYIGTSRRSRRTWRVFPDVGAQRAGGRGRPPGRLPDPRPAMATTVCMPWARPSKQRLTAVWAGRCSIASGPARPRQRPYRRRTRTQRHGA